MSPVHSRTSSAVSNGSVAASFNGTSLNHGNHKNSNVISLRPPAVIASQEIRVRKVLKLIESEPARSIQDLADECNLSQSHLQHLFKQHTGVQLGQLLLESRIVKAAQLLENSNMSVKEIAFAVGYEHTSSFIRAFERRFFIAPRCYRQRCDRKNS
jgi:transcriptional regulator GlxA family with amidase domain